MRLFIAIKIPDFIKEEIIKAEDALRQAGSDTKWVEDKNIHITLKFLGEVKESALPEVLSTIENLAGNNPPFQYEINGIGAFPSVKHPKILWIGIGKGKENIINLCRNLDEALDKIGFEKEKKDFHPHITIGRSRSGKNMNILSDMMQKTPIGVLKDDVESVFLIKSSLTPKGPVYEDVKEFKLGKKI